MAESETPGITVLSLARSPAMVNVTDTKGFFQTVLVFLFQCPSEFTIQCDVFYLIYL